MLDVLSYPVSMVMWLWHGLLGLAISPDSGVAWTLSVVLLVVTLRALLVVPTVKQLRSMRLLRELQPEIAALQAKYSHDRQELGRRIQRLQHDNKVSVLGGCLPALLQVPVFLGLYHLLTRFSRSGLTVEQSSHLTNGVFGPDQVSSFLHAQLFGAPLPAYVAMPADALQAWGANLGRADILAVAVPLVLLAGLMTHLTARQSVRRYPADQAGSGAALSKLTLWLFPLLPVLGGLFFAFPIAIALYWLANSVWTLGQNHILTRRLDAEDARRRAIQAAAPSRSRGPRPGQQPRRAGRGSRTGGSTGR